MENELDYSQDLKVLRQQNEYLVDTLDKLTERFNKLGALLLGKLDANPVSTRTVHVRPSRSADIDKIALALSQAAGDFIAINRSATGSRKPYASMEDLLEATVPALKKYELAANFQICKNEYNEHILVLTVSHSSNQWFELESPLQPEKIGNNMQYHQAIGASDTYLRRYMYRSFFNLGGGEE